MAKKVKKSIDQLAQEKARYEKHLARESATPRNRSGIKGRSLHSPVVEGPVEVEAVEETPEASEE